MIKSREKHLVFEPISLSEVIIEDCFWIPRLELNRNTSLFRQFVQLQRSGAIDNYKRITGQANGGFEGLYFIDSDVYKWIEASSYSLATHPNPQIEILVDKVIALIAGAQEVDGYINTYFQLVEPDKKFTNLGVCHELYNGGHLIQAGIANFKATGKKSLLQVACRFADHLTKIFAPGKLKAVDGHAGIEMALIELYRLTENKSYLKLTQSLIDWRGQADSRLRWELNHLDAIAGKPGKPGQHNLKFFNSYEDYDGRYAQDHLPVRRQAEVVGHAVRAMYLYCGMADLAAEIDDIQLVTALKRLWQHLTKRRMYVTGGIGSARTNEGFTQDYDLPNDTVCAESCAAVGLVMWCQRMVNLTGEGRYVDLMERVLYNAFLVGVSLDGLKYFYNNPLHSKGDCHREEWYECACCPPNISRILASLGGYIYSRTTRGLAVQLFVESQILFDTKIGQTVKLRQETRYPWDGNIIFSMEMEGISHFELLLRIPEWCCTYTVKLNHKKINPIYRDGYIVLERNWRHSDCIELELEMPIVRLIAHPAVWQNIGKVALQRGPLIYCIEEVDHDFPIEQMIFPAEAQLSPIFLSDLLGGIVVIEGEGLIPGLSSWEGNLYHPTGNYQEYSRIRFRAIPYYCWDNRQPGKMMVWLNANQ